MDILKNAYNREDFRVLINNIFQKSGIFLDIPENQEVSDEGKNKIESGYLLGEIKLYGKDFAIFEYKVKDELDLEKNKVGLVRKLIKNGKDYLFDAFLGVYYNEKTNIWRLSLVNIEYTENKEKTSSLKRYTYLLGENIPVNTAIKQIKTELIDKKVNNIDALLKAFSVEPVTKEFFNEIGRFFTKLISGKRKIGSKKFEISENERYLSRYPSIDKEEEKKFAVRLIGRIVFVWFLKKKDLIPEEILSSKAVNDNGDYYHDILEKLFFEVLNKKSEERLELIKNQ